MNRHVRAADLQQPFTVSDFKGAMRSLAGGVSVVTVGQGKVINGMTVSSVSSFSVDPPTMLVSVNRNASSFSMLVETGVFGINILSSDQQEVAERFSGKDGISGADRFANAIWRNGVTGVPLLVGATAALDCTVEDIIEKHSHAIVIGRVASISQEAMPSGMVYWNGGYIAL